MNAITAQIGADVAPLKKGMDAAIQIEKATAKKIADEQKNRIKQGEKDFADSVKRKADLERQSAERVAAYHKNANDKAKEILRKGKADGELARQNPLGVVGDFAGGFGPGGMLGSIVSKGGAAAAVVGAIGKSMWDASEGARKMHLEMGRMVAATQGMTGPQSGDAASSLFGEMLAKQRAKTEAGAKFTKFGLPSPYEQSQSNSFFDLIGEGVNDRVGAMTGKHSARDRDLDDEERVYKEIARLRKEAADAGAEDTEALRDRLMLGEREGALEESYLRAAREIAAIEHKMGEERASGAQMRSATDPIRQRAQLERREINRQSADAIKDNEEALEAAKAQSIVQQDAARNEITAQRQQVELLEKQAEAKRARAGATSNEERKRGFNAAADQLDIQIDNERFKLTEMTRAQEEQFVDAVRSAESAQIDMLSLTGREYEARAKIHHLQEQISDNARRMDYATPAQKAQLQAANAGLQGQINKLKIMEAMKSPATKAQDRAASRAGRRAQRLVNSRDADEANRRGTARNRVRLGDHLAPKAIAPQTDIANGIDASKTGKFIEQISKDLSAGRKFG